MPRQVELVAGTITPAGAHVLDVGATHTRSWARVKRCRRVIGGGELEAARDV
jgi:hypothetical protein